MTTRKSDKNLEKDKKKTPRKWKGPVDQRREKGAGTYPNQALVFHSRSGHNWVIDDSEGKESMTFQHRGGSAIQFQPNGAIQIVSHNSLYNLVFGQNRLTVTGANDMTVKGDGSLMVYGDFNKTVHGDFNLTATGDMNFTAENLNSTVRGNIDTQAKNETKKLEGSSATVAGGAVSMSSKDSFTVASRQDQLHLGGGKGINAQVHEGNYTANIEKSGNFHFQAKDGTFEAKIKDAIKFLSDSGAIHMIAQQAADILSRQGNITINAQQGTSAMLGTQGAHVESSSGSVNMQAQNWIAGDGGIGQRHQSGASQQAAAANPQEAQGATGQAQKASTTTKVAYEKDKKQVGDLA